MGDEDDRQRGAQLTPQPVAHLVAADPRKLDFEQDETGGRLAGRLQRGLARRHRRDRIAGAFHLCGHPVRLVLVAQHNKHTACTHGWSHDRVPSLAPGIEAFVP